VVCVCVCVCVVCVHVCVDSLTVRYKEHIVHNAERVCACAIYVVVGTRFRVSVIKITMTECVYSREINCTERERGPCVCNVCVRDVCV